MDAQELLDALRKKLGTRYQGELAEALGVSLQTLTNWKNSDKKLSVEQIAGAIAKSRQAAVKTSQYETIRPVVEFYGIGKAREQSLWKEMNLAFNRPRAIQKIVLVPHPKRNQTFSPGHEKLRQPKDTQLELCDLAYFFSAYQVVDGMINDLEALMVRGFANDLLNVKMETFAHSRR
ncbi:helix-turn-helix transcriptional regulator [Pseudomonas aeruginosa]|uniref:helix-turn-helix transcriptional regulator n=1 Tax=Pseudomonas aeruginosa TaxID=287 RepID=UPI0011820C20|nr:helix-turn-helix transcriptional regulator [Pseudomonas aeruginosa]QDR27038.1 helix-turn-helix transcriptional regulator [Pseudomonas aeruginosa]